MVPHNKYGYLEEFTELHIAPSLTTAPSTSSQNVRQISPRIDTRAEQPYVSEAANIFGKIERIKSRKDYKRVKVDRNNKIDKNDKNDKFNIWGYISTWLGNTTGPCIENINPSLPVSDPAFIEPKEHVDIPLRVQPIARLSAHSQNGPDSRNDFDCSPFQVFVDGNRYRQLLAATNLRCGTDRRFFKITKVKSPSQRRQEKKLSSKSKESDVNTMTSRCELRYF